MLRSIVIAMLAALALAGAAEARYLSPAAPLRTFTPERAVNFWTTARNHYGYVCHAGSGRVARSHCKAWRWARAELAQAQRRAYLASLPPHASAWRCIHRYEGAWNDPNAPYYGGLQMDLSFQQAYGAALLARKGTANHWTPLEQMWVAERAYASGRGFYPWPNTARYCGLI